jgi:hypothetical protein
MTGPELRDALIREIVKAHGGSASRWRQAVGQIKVYARETHAHCNWEVRPSGSLRDVQVVERAADGLRAALPYVEED